MANEPVAWHYPDGKPDQCTTDKEYAEKDPAWTPMYYKHEFVGLTDEERLNFLNELLNYGTGFVSPLDAVVRAIEAKLKEKNNG